MKQLEKCVSITRPLKTWKIPQISSNGSSASNVSSCSSASSSNSPTFITVGGIVDRSHRKNDDHRPAIEGYSEDANSWYVVTPMPEPRHHAGAVVLDGQLYVIGGSPVSYEDPSMLTRPSRSCFRYDPVSNTWSPIAPMKHARMYLAAAAVGGVVYALGGYDENKTVLKSVEFYNPDTNTWELTFDMSEPKLGTSAIGYNGLLYVTGGYKYNGKERIFLDTVECFDPKMKRWAIKDPLPVASCHASLLVVKNTLHHIGGATMLDEGVTSLDSILSYSEERDEWERVQTLNTARHDAGVTTTGSKIYVVGGLGAGGPLNSVECLDIESDNWRKDVTHLTNPVYGLNCCTIPRPQ